MRADRDAHHSCARRLIGPVAALAVAALAVAAGAAVTLIPSSLARPPAPRVAPQRLFTILSVSYGALPVGRWTRSGPGLFETTG